MCGVGEKESHVGSQRTRREPVGVFLAVAATGGCTQWAEARGPGMCRRSHTMKNHPVLLTTSECHLGQESGKCL